MIRMATLAVVVASLIISDARAANSIKVDAPVVTVGPMKGQWTIIIKGTTGLDKAEKKATLLTVTIYDPNVKKVKIDKQSWVPPTPGQTVVFASQSEPVTVTGIYDYTVRMDYEEADGTKKFISVGGSFEVK